MVGIHSRTAREGSCWLNLRSNPATDWQLPTRTIGGRPFALHFRRHALDTPPVLDSVLTCPHCDALATEIMPTNACLYLYGCVVCGTMIRAKPGDCCVFCSYGSVKCPPMQRSSDCCSDAIASDPK